MTADGSLLLALVTAPEATAQKKIKIQTNRKVSYAGNWIVMEKKTSFVEEAASLLQAIAFIIEHSMLLQ